MVRLGIGNAWKWAITELVAFVMLLCWVDQISRPIIALFLSVFLAMTRFQNRGTGSPRRRRKNRLMTRSSRLKLNPRMKRLMAPSKSRARGELLIPLEVDGLRLGLL
jgi:hypothetical protein